MDESGPVYDHRKTIISLLKLQYDITFDVYNTIAKLR